METYDHAKLIALLKKIDEKISKLTTVKFQINQTLSVKTHYPLITDDAISQDLAKIVTGVKDDPDLDKIITAAATASDSGDVAR